MKTTTQTASVRWLGGQKQGKGAITTPKALLSQIPFNPGRDGNHKATSPTELIAAAHAGSFSMTLAHELGQAGFHPERIETTVTVTTEPISVGGRITQIHLDILATVARMVEGDFVDAALRAKANCPVSQLLKANIWMQARLNRRGAARLLPHREARGPKRSKTK